jgi:hypothetical protein
MLFQRFDNLLFLAKGGKTVYFGEVGFVHEPLVRPLLTCSSEGSHILTNYFERNGAHKCPEDANPAEWMLEVSRPMSRPAVTDSSGHWCCSWNKDEYRLAPDLAQLA